MVQHPCCWKMWMRASRPPQASRCHSPGQGCTRTEVAAATNRATFPRAPMPASVHQARLLSSAVRAPQSTEHAEWQSVCADSKIPARRHTDRRGSQLLPGACDTPHTCALDVPEPEATSCRTCGLRVGNGGHVRCNRSNSRTFFARLAASIRPRRPQDSRVWRIDCEAAS